MSEQEHKRLFIGASLPESYVSTIQDFIGELSKDAGIRVVPKENLHITVAFFGKVQIEMIPNLMSLIQLCLKDTQPFSLEVDGWKLAPKAKDPRMIWLSLRRNDQFTALAHQLIRSFDQIQPTQQFRLKPIPHITIARLRHPVLTSEINLRYTLPSAPLAINKLILWESTLLPEGPVYTEVSSFSL
ncbi:MAG: RNA 2',3'-cyclic phosphodiesterase, partial [Bacteroidota bacterium]